MIDKSAVIREQRILRYFGRDGEMEWSARKRVEKLRYMHRNPVKRGLVSSAELWDWSSYRAYAFGESGPVRVNDWDVLKTKDRKPAA